MALDTTCTELGTLHNLSFALHPTQIDFGSKDHQYLGCLVGGILIIIGACAVSFTAVRLLRCVDENGDGLLSKEEVQQTFLRFVPVIKNADNVDLASVARHPNTILLAVIFVYQGVAFSSMRVLFHPDESLWRRIIGFIFAAATFYFPIWVRMKVLEGVTPRPRGPGARPRADARVRRWDIPRPPVPLQYALLSEQGDWVSCRRERHWVNSWQAAMRPFTAKRAAGGAFSEVMAMWALGLVNAPPTPSLAACGHVRVAAALVHFAQLCYAVFACPYRCVRDAAVNIVRFCALIAGLLILAADFYGGSADAGGNKTVSAFLSAASLAALGRAVLNIVAEGALLAKGWRAHSQMLEWGTEESEEEPEPPKDPSMEAEDKTPAGAEPLLPPAAQGQSPRAALLGPASSASCAISLSSPAAVSSVAGMAPLPLRTSGSARGSAPPSNLLLPGRPVSFRRPVRRGGTPGEVVLRERDVVELLRSTGAIPRPTPTE